MPAARSTHLRDRAAPTGLVRSAAGPPGVPGAAPARRPGGRAFPSAQVHGPPREERGPREPSGRGRGGRRGPLQGGRGAGGRARAQGEAERRRLPEAGRRARALSGSGSFPPRVSLRPSREPRVPPPGLLGEGPRASHRPLRRRPVASRSRRSPAPGRKLDLGPQEPGRRGADAGSPTCACRGSGEPGVGREPGRGAGSGAGDFAISPLPDRSLNYSCPQKNGD